MLVEVSIALAWRGDEVVRHVVKDSFESLRKDCVCAWLRANKDVKKHTLISMATTTKQLDEWDSTS